MKFVVDTHSHTLASGHAYNTIQEMAVAAKEHGMEVICLTEHAPQMPGSCGNFYFQNLRVLPRERWGIHTLFGVELNILNEQGEIDLPQVLLPKMDVVIASVHLPCYHGEVSKEALTKAAICAMENPYINIIGHPDDSRTPVDYEEVVRAAKRTNTLLEVNNSSMRPDNFRQNAKENVREMLRLCEKYGVMITTGSDAHLDLDVGMFPNVYSIIEECGFPEELIATTSFEKIKPFLNRYK